MKNRDELINYLIKKIDAQSYLEIGICDGSNHIKIKCKHKIGVDPNSPVSHVTHRMTSDRFFSQNKNMFDVIFVDGLHVYEQVYKDIINSLKFLNKNGYIICHDMNPPTEKHQADPRPMNQRQWNGDCWKAYIKLRSERSDLEMYVVNTDHGCGVIRLGEQKLINLPKDAFELDFDYLENNRKELLNLITVEEFFEKLND
jgi:predicted O-methyltransferase YrrM